MAINLMRRPMKSHPEGPLYAAIKAAGFSVIGFAHRMGSSRTTLWRIDRGEQWPAESWWHQAASLLGVEVEDIVPREDDAAA